MKEPSIRSHSITYKKVFFALITLGLLFYGIPAKQAYGTVLIVQSSTISFSSTTARTATLNHAVAVGQIIAFGSEWYSTATPTNVTSSCITGNLTIQNTTSTATTTAAQGYGVVNTAGSNCKVTINFATTTKVSMNVHAISGVNSSTPLDTSILSAVATATTSANSGNITTTQNGDYLFGTLFDMTASGVTWTTPALYTQQTHVSAGVTTADRVQSSAGVVNFNATSSASASNVAGILAFIAGTSTPSVSWVSPSNNASVSGMFTLTASSTDTAGGSIASVAFYRGSFGASLASSTLIGSSTVASGTQYSIPWNTGTMANGSTTLWTLTTDTNNNTSSASTTASINNTAPYFVQGNAGDAFAATTESVTLTGTSTVNAGDIIAVGVLVGQQSSTISSVAAPTCVSGNFTLVNNSTTYTTKSYAAMGYGIVSTTTASCQITATLSGTDNATLVLDAMEITGVATSSPLDGNALHPQTNPGTGANAITSGNATTTQNGDFIFGWTSNGSNGSFAPVAGTGYTAQEADPLEDLAESKVQSSAGSTATTFTDSTWGNSTGYLTGIMAFKATGTGPAPTISSFSASPTLVASAGTSTFSWNATGTITNIAITPGSFSTSTASGTTTINPTSTLTYTLTATNANGTSTATTTINVATAPTAPGSFAAANPSTSTVGLSWTSSTPNNGATVSFYTIYRGTSTSSMPQIATTTSLAYTDTGLTATTTYFYYATAQDSVGNVSASSSVSSTTTQGISAWSSLPVDLLVDMNTSTPSTPLSVAIMNAGTVSSDCTIGSTCTWGTPPTGALIVGPDQSSLANLGPVSLNGGSSSYGGESLDYNSIGHNDVDNDTVEELSFGGTITNASSVSTLVGITLGPPSQLNGDDWDMVSVYNAAGNYAVIQFNSQCGASYGVRIEVKPTAHSPCVSLTPQQSYFFDLYSNFATGLANLYVWSATGTPLGNVSITAGNIGGGGIGSIFLGNDEAGNNTSTVTYFQNAMVNWTTAPSPMFWTQNSSTPTIYGFSASSTLVAPSGASTLSWNVTNETSITITPGSFSTSTLSGSTIVNPTSTTIYTLTATNVNGTSTATTTVTVATAPTAPGSFSVGSPTTSTLALSWTSSTPNNGATVSFYTIYRGTSTSSMPQLATTTSLAYTDTSLATSTTYFYYATAQDSVGNISASSSIASSTTLSGLPPSISAFSASPSVVASAGTSTLTWNATGTVTNISISPGSFSTSTSSGTTTVNPTSTTIYTLTATNVNGTSTATTTVTVATAPTAPGSFSVGSPTTSTLALSWTSSTPNNGATISFYTIYRGVSTSTMPQVATTSAGTYTNTGLATSTTYFYYTTAQDSVGNTSASSSVASSTTLSGILPSINAFSASPSAVPLNGTSTLSWSTSNATSLSISPTIGTVTGTSTSTPALSTSTIYTLTATNANGTSTATTTVTVILVPIISAVASGTPGTTTATITWTTDQAADSLVEYGTSSTYTASSTYSSSYVTSHSVTLTSLNSLTTYHFRVDSSDGILATSSDYTFITASAGVPSASNVSASGTLTVGHTLTGLYNFSDPNNKPESGSTYEWLRASTSGGSYSPISGATSDTYALADADIGQYLEFQVTPVSQSGSGSPVISSSTTQINSSGAPTATSVGISGSSTEGQTLTGTYTYSQTDAVAQGTSLYQWLEASSSGGAYSAVASATGNMYALGPSDVGQYLEFEVTPVAVYPPTTGSTVVSSSTGPVQPSSLPVASNVTISGTPTIGQVLTGSYTYSDSGSNPEASSTYQWWEATSSAGSYTSISGATSTTYTLVVGDVAKYLKFQVTPVSTVATGTPVQSSATTQIQNSGPPTATSVAISGTNTETQTLTGTYTYSDPNNFAEASSTFQWLEATTTNGTYAAIGGATSKTYTLLSGDVNKYIEFSVVPMSSVPPTTGSATSSAPTTAIAPSSYPVASSVSISGSSTVGQLLTGSYTYSDTGGHAEASSTYVWLTASTSGGTYNPIGGATSLTYTLQGSDIGNYIKFQVTPVSTVATGSSTQSSAFGPVVSGSSTPPVISNIATSSITTSGAVITWNTNESADSTVSYGTTIGYGATSTNPTLLTSHSITLSGLSAGTLYYFAVTSAVSGTSTTSGDNTFTTTASSGGGGGGGGTVSVPESGGSYAPPSTSTIETTSSLEAEIAALTQELDILLREVAASSSSSPPAGSSSYFFTRNLRLWDEGRDVTALQEFLIGENTGPAARVLAKHGVTLTFGHLTYNALVEFQRSVGIRPTSGYFGPLTRAWVNGHQ